MLHRSHHGHSAVGVLIEIDHSTENHWKLRNLKELQLNKNDYEIFISTNLSCIFLLIWPLRVDGGWDNSNLSIICVADVVVVVTRRHVVVVVVDIRVHVRNARRTVHGGIARWVDIRLRLYARTHQTRGLDAIVVFVSCRTSHSIGSVAIFTASTVASSLMLSLCVEICTVNRLHVFSQWAWIGVSFCTARSFTNVRFLFIWMKKRI